jgi:Family of unknown function (DUF6127)
MSTPRTITMPKSELEALLDAAALKGALEALKRVGLDDGEAPIDVWLLRRIVWFLKIWTRRAVISGVALFFITLTAGAGWLIRRWLGS